MRSRFNELGWLTAAVLVVSALPGASRAYYVEVRGSNSEAGVDRPITYDDGAPASADTVDVTYRVNSTSFPDGVAGVAEAIDAAFATWSGETCANIVFNPGPESMSSERTHWVSDMGEVYVLVYFSDNPTDWTASPQAVGNFFWAHDGTGRLIGGTVVLNSAAHGWATDGNLDRLDVQSITTALIGRSLGISSNMEDNSTFPRYAPGDTSKRMLGMDDRAAIQFLYTSTAMGCDAITPPEAECAEITLPGEPECPPPVMTNPGDGGTLPPRDGGPMTGLDAGPSPLTDGGTGDGGDGCSCRVGARRGGGVPWALCALGALLAMRRIRRR